MTESEKLLKMLENGGGSFISFKRALSGLSDEQARIVPEGSPHSVADMLGHIQFWQAWVLDSIEGKKPPLPEHAAGGWPTITEGGWETLVEAFMTDLERCKIVAQDGAKLDTPFFWGQEEMTIGFAVLDTAMHNGHHLGQIVLLRRIIGAWPPEGGMYTW